jgi:hypothetical protein
MDGSNYDWLKIILQAGAEVAGELSLSIKRKWHYLQSKYRLRRCTNRPYDFSNCQ